MNSFLIVISIFLLVGSGWKMDITIKKPFSSWWAVDGLGGRCRVRLVV